MYEYVYEKDCKQRGTKVAEETLAWGGWLAGWLPTCRVICEYQERMEASGQQGVPLPPSYALGRSRNIRVSSSLMGGIRGSLLPECAFAGAEAAHSRHECPYSLPFPTPVLVPVLTKPRATRRVLFHLAFYPSMEGISHPESQFTGGTDFDKQKF